MSIYAVIAIVVTWPLIGAAVYKVTLNDLLREDGLGTHILAFVGCLLFWPLVLFFFWLVGGA